MKTSKIKIIGQGEECPKCLRTMERRTHNKKVEEKSYFYTQWDYCKNCKHVQHYEKFKSSMWKEAEERESHMRSI